MKEKNFFLAEAATISAILIVVFVQYVMHRFANFITVNINP